MKGAIKLSTGTLIEPYNGTIGINEDLEVTAGYDSHLRPYAWREEWMTDLDGDVLTFAEQIELGEIMITLWRQFIDRARNAVEETSPA